LNSNIWLNWLNVDRHLSYIKNLKKKPFVHCAQQELAEMFESVIHNFAGRSVVTFTLTTIMTWGLCEILEPVLVIKVCNPGSSFPQPNDYLQKRLHPLIMPSH
jgi:hypothetical protein